MQTTNFTIDKIHLRSQDEAKMRHFYETVLRFIPRQLDTNTVEYAVSPFAEAVLQLTFDLEAETEGRSAGLYHYAILMQERETLAAVLQQLINNNYPLIGGGDHLVSEAIYLEDPEGNGIELYYDRPASSWQWQNGEVLMDTLPVDIDELLTHAYPWEGFPESTRIGHLHFYGSNINDGDQLFINILAMDMTAEMGAHAHFYSNNHYHHHFALNTWKGNGIPLHNPAAKGLMAWQISVNPDYFALIAENLRKNNRNYENNGSIITTRDAVGSELIIKNTSD